jgi:hypothetical protein
MYGKSDSDVDQLAKNGDSQAYLERDRRSFQEAQKTSNARVRKNNTSSGDFGKLVGKVGLISALLWCVSPFIFLGGLIAVFNGELIGLVAMLIASALVVALIYAKKFLLKHDVKLTVLLVVIGIILFNI